MNRQQILAAISRCNQEIEEANVYGRKAQFGTLLDRQLAGLWLMDWEQEKYWLLGLLALEVAAEERIAC